MHLSSEFEEEVRRIAREEAMKALQEYDSQFSTEAMPIRSENE